MPPTKITIADYEQEYGERTVDVILKWWNLIPKSGDEVIHKSVFMKFSLQVITLLEVEDELDGDPDIELNERWGDGVGEDKWTMTHPEFVVMMAEVLRWCIDDDDTDVYLDTQVALHLSRKSRCANY